MTRYDLIPDFRGGLDDKVSVYNAGDLDSIPGSGRSPGEGNGNPLQYSCLENPMDRGAGWATVHRVAKSRTRLSDFTFTFTFLYIKCDESISSVQSLSHVQLFATPWTESRQASLSIVNSWSLLKLMSIQSVMSSNHLILCHPLLLPLSIFPSIRVFSRELTLRIRSQSIGASASASVLPMNIQH